MKKITLITTACLLSCFGAVAQTSTCVDLNGYVGSKNVGVTGFYNLQNGFEEKASQTYHYSGPGKVSQVRVYGSITGSNAVPLRVTVFNVDVNGRPTSALASVDEIFGPSDAALGYILVSMPAGGTTVSNDFAIGIEILNAAPWGTSFQLKYTGDGEGLGADLASLAGTSTGHNWSSAMTNFNKNGDFYLVPKMTNFIMPDFTASSHCLSTGGSVSFTNNSSTTQDTMFNQIGLDNYTGSNYYYSWNFGDGSAVSHSTNPSHTYATAGTYTVTLTNTLVGWEGTCNSSETMTISVGLATNANSISNVSCNAGNNGSFVAAATGGTSPYSYSLDGGLNYQTSAFNNLSAGNYTLQVRDANGCMSTSSFTITQPSAINFTTASSTNASCGNNDGSILVAAAGGAGSIQYQLNSGAFQTSGSYTGLAAGAYVVTAKDANGCTKVTTVMVNNLGAPALSVLSTTNVSCNGGNDGTIVLNATGGVGTLQYSINGGTTFQTTGSFLGLTAGTYSVMVKDASNCRQSSSVIISQPSAIAFTSTSYKTSCFGGNDGQINVTSAIGGIGTLTYSLNNGSYQSGTNFSGLAAGTYTISVKDAAACVQQATVIVTQPAQIMISNTVTAAGCYGYGNGSVVATVTGGTSPYSYSINGGEQQPTSGFYDLTSGTYTVMVEDINGCTASSNATIIQPTQVTATATATNSTCGNSNGGLLILATGGSGSGYQYSLDGINFNSSGSFSLLPAGNYFITVKDGTGCKSYLSKTIFDSNGPSITSSSSTDVACHGGHDGSITVNTVTGGTGTLLYSINGVVWSTNSTFVNLTAGAHSVYVKDANGCIGTISVTLSEPSGFVITNSLVNVNCHDANTGSATILAAGGAGTLAYSIDGTTFQSSNTFSNLPAGNYEVIVRDIASCMGETFFTITQPTEINFVTGILNVSCAGSNNGAITVYAYGGTGALVFSLNGNTYQSSNVFTGLPGGTYTVFVKDANGCVVNHAASVYQPDPLEINSNVSDVSCSGGNNGVIDLTITGGSGINNIVWSNGSVSEDIFSLNAGAYSVDVEDNNGCSATSSFVISEPLTPIIVNAVVVNTTGTSGMIDATVTGGTAPYTYSWSNGALSQDIGGLTPGTYSLTVTDVNGCISTNDFVVEDALSLTAINGGSIEVNVYPNPSSDIATVEINGSTIEKISLVDMAGKTVFETESDVSKIEIQTSSLEPGLYFIHITVDGKTLLRKLNVIR
jgi:hypothetical protein